MTPPLLELRSVSFAYRGRPVLRDVSFAVQRGEAVALLGPNGAGKTTLLRIAAGLLAPDSGEVLLEGRPVAQFVGRQRAQRVAMVPQQLQIPFAYTVEEIVSQGRTPYRGQLPAENAEALERALSLTSTAGFRNRVFAELSGGEQQRVKLALGLAQTSDLLLLDEPAQSLDAGWQQELLSTMAGLRLHGLGVLAAVHELHLVSQYFSRSLLLAPGEPLLDGPTDEVLAAEMLDRAFFAQHRRPTEGVSA